MRRIALIDIQLKGEPLVVGFNDNYASDQIITCLTTKQAHDILTYPRDENALVVDTDCEKLLRRMGN